jgi:hypothetical protein
VPKYGDGVDCWECRRHNARLIAVRLAVDSAIGCFVESDASLVISLRVALDRALGLTIGFAVGRVIAFALRLVLGLLAVNLGIYTLD